LIAVTLVPSATGGSCRGCDDEGKQHSDPFAGAPTEHIRPGEALELVREPANQNNDHAVAYHHRGVHLGYVPRRHRWIAKALDDGLRLAAIVETVKIGRIFRHRAKFVGTRIVVLYDGR
jgi:HIRAN domain